MEDNKTEIPKKKSIIFKIFYWIIVLCGSGFIFYGSYEIGNKLGKYYETKKTSCNTAKKEENIESNNNEDLKSNIVSNSNEENNSDITICNEESSNDNYIVRDFAGEFVSKEANLSYKFSTQATYETDVYGIAGCGESNLGNFIVEGNKIYLYPLVSKNCDEEWDVLNTSGKTATIISKNEIQIDGKRYIRDNDTSLNEAIGGLRNGLRVLKEYEK